MNKENNKKVRIKVRLSEEENEKLKRYSAVCGLSESGFIRQLCKGKHQKQSRHRSFGTCSKRFTRFIPALRNAQSTSLLHLKSVRKSNALYSICRRRDNGDNKFMAH